MFVFIIEEFVLIAKLNIPFQCAKVFTNYESVFDLRGFLKFSLKIVPVFPLPLIFNSKQFIYKISPSKNRFFQKKKRKNLEVKKKTVLLQPQWDGSSVGLERMLDRHEVTSSILVRPT